MAVQFVHYDPVYGDSAGHEQSGWTALMSMNVDAYVYPVDQIQKIGQARGEDPVEIQKMQDLQLQEEGMTGLPGGP